MNQGTINSLLKSGNLRLRETDREKIKSMIKFAEENAEVAKSVHLTEKSATLIFREIYESIRQLGEANWWIEGYEPQGIGSHVLSLDILKELDIKEKVKLNYLDRFKDIRHAANYKGFRVLISQAEEIMEFWDTCGVEIAGILRKIVK